MLTLAALSGGIAAALAAEIGPTALYAQTSPYPLRISGRCSLLEARRRIRYDRKPCNATRTYDLPQGPILLPSQEHLH